MQSHSNTTQLKNHRPAGARVGIPPRHIDFGYVASEERRYFVDDNALATAFVVMLSAFFPPGERFFVESVRRYREQITDPTLKAQVAGFIGQEAIHGKEHERLNDLFAKAGYDMQMTDNAIKTSLWFLERLPTKTQLACTIFLEHFTARFAQQLLTDENFRARADQEMLKLWQWHALEELEHKAVAYDVYDLAGNSQAERILVIGLCIAALVPTALASWGLLVLRDPDAGNLKEHARGLKLLLGRGGFVSSFLSKMPVFGRRDFHPAIHDTRALVGEWRKKLFGEGGSLRDALKNRDALEVM